MNGGINKPPRPNREERSEMSVYQEHGYEDRADYIHQLAEVYGLMESMVWQLADLLGPEEDFDGLVVACQDAEHQLFN